MNDHKETGTNPTSLATTVCQVCGDPLSSDGIVYCASCGTAHHETCWLYTHKCSTYGCGSTLCSNNYPSSSSTKALLFVEKEKLVSATPSKLSLPPKNSLFNLSLPLARLDYEAPLEKFVLGLTIFSVFATIGCLIAFIAKAKAYLAAASCVFAALALLFGKLQNHIDCTYVVDNTQRTIYFMRRIFGYINRRMIGTFEAVKFVTVQGRYQQSKNSSWWEYKTVLVLNDGKVIPVSDETIYERKKRQQLAKLLADHFSATYDAGQEHALLVVKRKTKLEIEICHVPYSALMHSLLPIIKILIICGMILLPIFYSLKSFL